MTTTVVSLITAWGREGGYENVSRDVLTVLVGPSFAGTTTTRIAIGLRSEHLT